MTVSGPYFLLSIFSTTMSSKELKEVVAKVPKQISVALLHNAIRGILNNSIETKDPRKPVLDLDVVAAFRSMFPAGKTYRFDMVTETRVGADGSGSMTQTLSISPAVVSYNEWPALSALFDEVKLVSSKVIFIPLVGSDGSGLTGAAVAVRPIIGAVACGPNYNNISTGPSGYVGVLRLAESVNILRLAGENLPGVVMLKPRTDLPYARTSTPAILDPPCGVLGSFDVAQQGGVALTPSFVYYSNVLRTTVVLRNRA
jgi:hypothetical protein